jgi:hypothetical protein
VHAGAWLALFEYVLSGHTLHTATSDDSDDTHAFDVYCPAPHAAHAVHDRSVPLPALNSLPAQGVHTASLVVPHAADSISPRVIRVMKVIEVIRFIRVNRVVRVIRVTTGWACSGTHRTAVAIKVILEVLGLLGLLGLVDLLG